MIDRAESAAEPANDANLLVSRTGSWSGPVRLSARLVDNLPTVVESILPPLAIFTVDGRPLYANAALRRVLGHSGADADLQSLEVLRDWMASSPRPIHLGEHNGANADVVMEFAGRCYRVETQNLVGNVGETYVVALFRDVTAERRDLVAAQQAQDRLRDFVECSSDWIWETGPEGRLTALSRRLTQIAGRPAALLRGSRFRDFGRFPKLGDDDVADSEPFRTRQPFSDLVFEMPGSNGKVFVQSIAGVPIFDPQTGTFRGYRGTGTDVTNQVAAHTALEQSQSRLRDAVQALRRKNTELEASVEAAEAGNRARAALLANVSHELRTPLNAILGFADMLRMEVFGAIGDTHYRSYSEDIYDSARHLLDLITHLLDLSTIEAGGRTLQMADVPLADELRSVSRMFLDAARQKSVSLVVQSPDADVTIRAESRALRQILTNLIGNAVKFTPSGGQVTVSAQSSSGMASLCIADSGIGMDSKDIARVAQPFVRGGHEYVRHQDGAGLGLALSKSLIDLHGGELKIDSVLGAGTTVTVLLPQNAATGGGGGGGGGSADDDLDILSNP